MIAGTRQIDLEETKKTFHTGELTTQALKARLPQLSSGHFQQIMTLAHEQQPKPSTRTNVPAKGTIVVYLLKSTHPRTLTYCGYSVDLQHRIRQHNGAIKGGAKYTSKRPGGWCIACWVAGFVDKIEAMKFEYRAKRTRGLDNRIALMQRLASEHDLTFHAMIE